VVPSAFHPPPPQAASRVRSVGIDRVPACGTNDEVIEAHGLGADALVDCARRELSLLLENG
jgi:hypothetical protein